MKAHLVPDHSRHTQNNLEIMRDSPAREEICVHCICWDGSSDSDIVCFMATLKYHTNVSSQPQSTRQFMPIASISNLSCFGGVEKRQGKREKRSEEECPQGLFKAQTLMKSNAFPGFLSQSQRAFLRIPRTRGAA